MGNPFKRVPLGRTALEVTQFGLGSAQLGWMYEPVSRQQALDTLRRAHELGCGFFDTSPLYGSGLAESRFGAVLPSFPRESFTLSDKVGYAIYPDSPLPNENVAQAPPAPGKDYSYDGALRMVEGSLKRLGLDRIDIMLIHDPDEHMDEALNGTYPALRPPARRRAWSAPSARGMNDSRLLARLAREGDFDCFLMAGRYTLLDQTALADLLPLAEERGIAIYVGGPFNSGILADPFAPNVTFKLWPGAPRVGRQSAAPSTRPAAATACRSRPQRSSSRSATPPSSPCYRARARSQSSRRMSPPSARSCPPPFGKTCAPRGCSGKVCRHRRGSLRSRERGRRRDKQRGRRRDKERGRCSLRSRERGEGETSRGGEGETSRGGDARCARGRGGEGETSRGRDSTADSTAKAKLFLSRVSGLGSRVSRLGSRVSRLASTCVPSADLPRRAPPAHGAAGRAARRRRHWPEASRRWRG